MDNNKKVWLSFPNSNGEIKIYAIGMNIPGLYDFLALQENSLKLARDKDNEELSKKNIELGAYGLQIAKMVRGYKKFPVLPDGLWLTHDMDEWPRDSEYVFMVRGGGVVLKEACADIFKQFRLGESTLTPVKIHQALSHELWRDETYYFLNLCEQRQFVCKEQQHERLQYKELPSGKWKYVNKFMGINVDYVRLDRAAADCDVDLWHDPRLVYDSYFMSDGLYQALRDAGFADLWAAGACPLI